jgi:uridylate kinase
VILASGLGKVGYISTDLSAVIKALEIKADAVIKISKLGGLYDKDPKSGPAKLIKNISYEDVITRKLAVMDFSAIAIAAEHNLPVAITSIHDFPKFMDGEKVGSIVGNDWR